MVHFIQMIAVPKC